MAIIAMMRNYRDAFKIECGEFLDMAFVDDATPPQNMSSVSNRNPSLNWTGKERIGPWQKDYCFCQVVEECCALYWGTKIAAEVRASRISTYAIRAGIDKEEVEAIALLMLQ